MRESLEEPGFQKKKSKNDSSPARNRTRSCCVRDSDVSHYTTEDFSLLPVCPIERLRHARHPAISSLSASARRAGSE